MRVSDIMSRSVTVCTEDAGLEEVYELIQKCEDKLVVVIDSHAHRVPIGVASEHSICEQIIARGRNPRILSAGSVMDARIKKVSEEDLLGSLGAEEIKDLTAIVVVDSNRRISGLLSTEAIKRITPLVSRDRPALTVSVNSPPASPRRISEIPAFGWIQ